MLDTTCRSLQRWNTCSEMVLFFELASTKCGSTRPAFQSLSSLVAPITQPTSLSWLLSDFKKFVCLQTLILSSYHLKIQRPAVLAANLRFELVRGTFTRASWSHLLAF